MNCIFCKKEFTEKSPTYEGICLECHNRIIESDKKRDEFTTQYRLDHAACPNCGDSRHTTTLAGYIYNHDKPDEYKDLNRCECIHCGNIHTAHERIQKRI